MNARRVSGKLVQGLWGRALKGALPAGLLEELRALGVDPARPDLHVDWDTFAPAVERTAAAMWPGKADGVERLGAKVVESLRTSIPGAVLTVGKLMGPRQVLRKAIAQPLKGIEWLTLDLEDRGRKEAAISVNEPAAAPFLLGALRALLQVLGESPVVRLEAPGRVVARW